MTAQTELETYKTLTGEDKPVSGWLAELRSRNKSAAPRPPKDEAVAPAPETPASDTPPADAPKPQGG